MTAIERDLAGATSGSHDLIVIGGGIYGVMLALESARRGRRALLVERGDFGEATSHNNLRIVHGGLRYLQSADLPRFRESVAERRWFLRHLPELVEPLGCLMPLDGRGTRRPWLLGPALAANDLLSAWRNRGLSEGRRIERGRLLGAAETARLVPRAAEASGSRSAALWWDAFAPDMPRLVLEVLRWACAHGVRALNYCEAEGLLREGARVAGVRVHDHVGGRRLELRAPLVINAAGPWCRGLAAAEAPEDPTLFEPALAWNVLFDRAAPSPHALAVAAPRPGAPVLFAVPWHGRLLVGTGHAAWSGGPEAPVPAPDVIESFVADVSAALPGLDLGVRDVARVFSGLLPTTRRGSSELTKREVVVDHGRRGGPQGFYSVSGIKFTTARRVADKTLRRVLPDDRPRPWDALERPGERPPAAPAWDWLPKPEEDAWLEALRPLAADPSVHHLDDLLLRRTPLADNPRRVPEVAERVCGLFEWDDARRRSEIERVRARLERGLPEAARAGRGVAAVEGA